MLWKKLHAKNCAAWKKTSPLFADTGVKLRTQFCTVLAAECAQHYEAELSSHSYCMHSMEVSWESG